jgi:hypothetical protein
MDGQRARLHRDEDAGRLLDVPVPAIYGPSADDNPYF